MVAMWTTIANLAFAAIKALGLIDDIKEMIRDHEMRQQGAIAQQANDQGAIIGAAKTRVAADAATNAAGDDELRQSLSRDAGR